MKRIITLLLAVLLITTLFVGCAEKEFECDMCKEVTSGKKNKIQYDGEKAYVCSDCFETYNALKGLLG